MDARAAQAQHRAGHQHALDTGLRHHRQAAIRPPRRRRHQLQPHKPGRPSHAIHTYWIGNLRLVLDAQLDSGNRHSPSHGRAGLVALLEGLPQAQRPQLVRGDSAFGSEGEMAALETLGQPYLFKLRQSPGVKKLMQRQWNRALTGVM
ncbi:MAG: transposase [Polaromonas sp.]